MGFNLATYWNAMLDCLHVGPVVMAAPNLGKRHPRWPTVRKHFLEGKVCAACGGKEYLEAHHVLPFHKYPDLELEPGNLICLCQAPGHYCHFVWGHAYNFLKYVPRVRENVAWWRQQQTLVIGPDHGGQQP